jgi:hypothetical protein
MAARKYKASVLAVSLIVMGIILASAISISTAALRERKGSIGEGKSSQAFQAADAGIEVVMNNLIVEVTEPAPNPPLISPPLRPNHSAFQTLSEAGLDYCDNNSGLIENEDYKVRLLKSESGSLVEVDCGDPNTFLINITKIRSVGTVGNTQRTVSTDVIFPDITF